MDRRAWGTALVAVVLLGALVVPNLAGRRVVGSAVPIPVPDPPRVGQCVLASVAGATSALDFNQVTVSSATTGPCGERNFGEVVSVTVDMHEFPSTVSNRMSHPEPLACLPAARRYVGWTVPATDDLTFGEPAGSEPEVGQPAGPARVLGPWRPVSTTSIGLVGPTLWQYMSGQNWLTCVLLPRDAPYAGSVRGGPAGTASSAFAACWLPADPVPRRPVPCSEPHSGETFGVARLDNADLSTLEAACFNLVGSATGMTDPTHAGAITVQVQFGGSNRAAVDQDSIGQASCTISTADGRLLTQSLTGVGDGPLPWA